MLPGSRISQPARLSVLLCALLVIPAASGVRQDALSDARALRLAGRPAEAADRLELALRATPQDESLLGLYGLCLLDAGRNDEAIAFAGRFAGYTGPDARLHTALGRVQRLQGDTGGAVRAFHAALALNPEAVEASVELVAVHISENRFGAALSTAEALEARMPDMGRRLAARALAAHGRRHHVIGGESLGSAIEKYREALARTPDDLAIARPLVECLLQAIRVDEARERIQLSFSAEALRTERLYYRARCLGALSDAAGARAAYLAVLEVDARHALSALELAKLDLDEGNPAGAKMRLLQITGQGGNSRLSLLLGMAELGLGNDKAAEAALRESVRLDPGGANTKAVYQLGRLLVRTGRAAEGREYLLQVSEAQR